jgi:hypothetical protein
MDKITILNAWFHYTAFSWTYNFMTYLELETEPSVYVDSIINYNNQQTTHQC